MSFDLLIGATARKEEHVEFKVGEQTVVFTVREVTANERAHLFELNNQESEWLTHLARYSVYDKDGRRMSLEQARTLQDVYMNELLKVALKVNGLIKSEAESDEKGEQPEKNSPKKKNSGVN